MNCRASNLDDLTPPPGARIYKAYGKTRICRDTEQVARIARAGPPALRRELEMTFVVTDNCIKCKYTDCVEVCPVDCFTKARTSW
jgi:Fe-S-cluster-containing dehydrogenase component